MSTFTTVLANEATGMPLAMIPSRISSVGCCAAADDFIRLSDQCKEILADLESASSHSKESLDTLAQTCSHSLVVMLFLPPSVYTCTSLSRLKHEEEIDSVLFDAEWEESLIRNELALTLMRTLEDYMGNLEIWLEELSVKSCRRSHHRYHQPLHQVVERKKSFSTSFSWKVHVARRDEVKGIVRGSLEADDKDEAFDMHNT
jgi:hypothetical protein